MPLLDVRHRIAFDRQRDGLGMRLFRHPACRNDAMGRRTRPELRDGGSSGPRWVLLPRDLVTDRRAGCERRRRHYRADLDRGRGAATCEEAGKRPQPPECVDRERAVRPARGAERPPTVETRAQVRAERTTLVRVERAGGETPNGHAVQPLAEDEVLRHAVASREQRLLDLCARQRELARGLVDAEAV